MIVPFFIPHAGCPHQCVFCNQKNITGTISSPDPSTIAATIRSYLHAAPSPGPVQVAFYGGSFTALPLKLQQSYLEPVQPFVEAGEVARIRISTRPDTVSADILGFLKRYHVGTVEIGAQSMNDGVLARSGRGHSAGDTVRAVRLLREHVFTVGLQLMPGLPGDSEGDFGDTVGTSIEIRPDFVRIYPALVIRNTPLELIYRSGAYRPLSLDEAVAWCRSALGRFEEAGINVVRMGLQPTEELERPGTIVAGPYHPAFRQLVESSLMLERMRTLLGPACRGADLLLLVNPRDLSSAIGQKRGNVRQLRRELGVASIRFRTDASVPKGQVRLAACAPATAEV